MLRKNRKILEEMRDKKVILNKCVLGNEDIATFEYDKEGYPELHYCGSRPLELDEHESELFRILIKEGYGYKRNEDGQIIKIDFAEEYD